MQVSVFERTDGNANVSFLSPPLMHRCMFAPSLLLAWALLAVAPPNAAHAADGRAESLGNDGSAESNILGQLQITAETLAEPVDFLTDVFPLLENRCTRCHNHERADGDLRLDDRDAILRGGHTGRPILGSIENSELLRRVISNEKGYRMPKDSAPLAREQVHALARWIHQGAPWDSPTMIDRFYAVSTTHNWSRTLEQLGELSKRLRPIGLLSVVALFTIWWIERRKLVMRNSKGLHFDDAWIHRIHYSHYGLVVLTLLLAVVCKLHYHSLVELNAYRQPHPIRPVIDLFQPVSADHIPRPYRPPHPRRLGGTYYRGNDERNEHLYNNGFYRTATMTIRLRDATGRDLQWNDKVEAWPLAVHLKIMKAPFATPALFHDIGLTACALTRQIPNVDSIAMQDTPVHLEVIESGESWQATYPLAKPLEGPSLPTEHVTLSGLLYLGPDQNAPHYGIQYDIHVTDGRIEPTSELWMGAIYLTGNVRVPRGGEIPLADWFGFQPIPEIEGGNTDDPDLLGITEHEETAPKEAQREDSPADFTPQPDPLKKFRREPPGI